MKTTMNILLLIAGIVLIAISVGNLSRPAQASAASEPKPKDGDIQIRQQGETFWTYKWVSEPGWKLDTCYHSLDEARAAQKKAQERRKDEVVVK